ncbi:MAG: caspase family protein [Ketobacter sp.]|nr:caspase family protein [Ketobacter sp.]|tara:strand:- start:692 stop:2746 length:2055 start_codon:yes stop_codon:yes gene_type:complete
MRAPKGFQLTASGFCIGFLSVILSACATAPNQPGNGQAAETKNADDLLIIDCLLPGQVKKLGTQTTFLTARRPIKTTATDCEIRGGEYVAFDRADYATALKIWLPVAQSGDAEAQTYVGEIYEKGLGLKPDYQAASVWYEKAAKQNFSRALINLGNLYEKGLGVAQDKAMALNLYRQAAGLQSDDLLYASTVEVRAVDQKELIRLKDEVAFKSQQLAAAEGQLANLQADLAQRKQALAAAEQTQKNAELALFAQESKAIHEQSQALIKQLKSELSQARLAVDNQQQQLAAANQQLNQISNQVASTNTSILQSETLIASADTMPIIEIIDPPMTLMRGLPTIPVKASLRQKEIVGKIKAPNGLKSFKVNGREQTIDEYNLFWVNVPIDGDRKTVKLEAIDTNNNRVAFNFSVVPDQSAVVSSVPDTAQPLAVKSGLNLGNYHALVIGNNDYRSYPKLKTAVNDATETASVLQEKFGFKTTVLKNATRYEILAALNELREQLTDQDNLLIYYAGHGELDDKTDKGFWLPVDAEQGNSRNWISNAAISDILNTLKAKHVMVVADSCYAGTLSVAAMPRVDESMPDDLQKEWILAMSQARARTVLTSGGVAPVLDGGGDGHSVFSRAFLDTLRKSDGIIEGHSVYREVLSRVQTKARSLNVQQVPEYAPARYAGHEAGEFFFNPGTTI